jgi:hypothetical protein
VVGKEDGEEVGNSDENLPANLSQSLSYYTLAFSALSLYHVTQFTMSTTTNSSSTNAGSALAASIHGTPAATLLDEGFSYATRKEFLTYLESNAVTTRTFFNTMKVSEYKNWLIFPNEKPRAPVGNTNYSSISTIYECLL